LKRFVERELERFEKFIEASNYIDEYMNDNFNTTWYLINNPAPYVRKNETFNI